ncbi:MAG: transglutaminase-like domain-containing protein [Thermodesulfobacteriota bacterium]
MNEEYLAETDVIRLCEPVFLDFVSRALEGAKASEAERASALFLAVRDRIIYDPYVPFFLPEHYTPGAVIARGRGYCVMKAVLLCAACRKAGIPARLGFAELQNRGAPAHVIAAMGTDIFAWHGFTEILLGGKWLKATPSFTADLCRRHNIAPLAFDGTGNAVFPPFDLSGKPYAEYLEYHGSYADLPLDAILAGWRKVYGNDTMDLWLAAFKQQGA